MPRDREAVPAGQSAPVGQTAALAESPGSSLGSNADATMTTRRTVGGANAMAAAQDEYQACHWQQAFLAFAALADRGDADAARIALAMNRHGKSLYGVDFTVSQTRLQSWLMLQAKLEASTQSSGAPPAPALDSVPQSQGSALPVKP